MPKATDTPRKDTDDVPGCAHDTPSQTRDNSNRKAETGGRDGPDPTRYGDWEKAGRCIDF